MAIDISHLRRVTASQPPRVLIYGPPGLGKTSLASEWPNPVFLQTEDGTPGGADGLVSFGHLQSYDEVAESIRALYDNEHDRKTVVLDSLDRLEPMLWAKVCSDNNWPNIESPGYGKGYVTTDIYWRYIIEGMNGLRRDKNMNVVYISHSTIAQVDDPMTQSYSRFDIRLHKRAVAIIQDEVDAILFLNQDITIKEDTGAKKGAVTRHRADGGGNRYIYATPRPSFVAKNRYDIANKIQFVRGQGYQALAPSFPAQPKPPAAEKTEEAPKQSKKSKAA